MIYNVGGVNISIVEDLRNDGSPMDSIKIIDHVISMQIYKINLYTNQHPKETLSSATEEAMGNLISLIELRNSYLKNNSLKKRH